MANLQQQAVGPRGKYRINTVAEMTGVPAATLRAWERRYGLPEPRRTESSYRVYSDRDIAVVRRVRELCDQGMAPSEAAKLVLDEQESKQAPAVTPTAATDAYQGAVDQILEGVMAFEPGRIEDAVRRALVLGPATAIFDKVLAPAMFEVGTRWHAGQVTIAQEHIATQLIEGAALSMLRLVEPEHTDRSALAACFADETHTLPLVGVSLHLSAWGFRVIRLGARSSPGVVASAVAKLAPDIVALSATMAPPPHRARELVEEYSTACHGVPWVVGGEATGAMADIIKTRGGHVIGSYTPRSLRALVDQLTLGRGRTG